MFGLMHQLVISGATRQWAIDNGKESETSIGTISETKLVHFIGKDDIAISNCLIFPVMLETARRYLYLPMCQPMSS
jgi:methionyl-tRNA synthetase